VTASKNGILPLVIGVLGGRLPNSTGGTCGPLMLDVITVASAAADDGSVGCFCAPPHAASAATTSRIARFLTVLSCDNRWGVSVLTNFHKTLRLVVARRQRPPRNPLE
jgi:hypothetical protein